MHSKTLPIILILCVLLFNGCVSYQVAARRDPFVDEQLQASTFSFIPDPNSPDSVLEKKLFYIIANTLESRGWIYNLDGTGEYLFRVNFAMETVEKTESRSVQTYNVSTETWGTEQEVYTDIDYRSHVRIIASRKSNSDDPFWSAECTSIGSTEDVMYAASVMIPYAMNKFPEEGRWNKSQLPKENDG